MNLWVRSQNKGTLMKVEILGHTDGVIQAYFANGNCELGTYKSSERALEVLDEIHNILKPKGILKFNAMIHDKDLAKIKKDLNDEYLVFGQNVELIQQPTTYVYEMPLE